VIDDDASVRRTLCSQLETAGFQTVEAGKGTTGMAAVRQTKPSVVVVDIIRPEREGLSTIKESKEKHPATRILTISGGGIGDAGRYLQFALNLGADDIPEAVSSRGLHRTRPAPRSKMKNCAPQTALTPSLP